MPDSQDKFDSQAFMKLLEGTPLPMIKSDEECDQLLELVQPLHFEKDTSPEKTALYMLLVHLIEKYEENELLSRRFATEGPPIEE